MTEQTEPATASTDIHSPAQTDSPEMKAALRLRDKLLTTERWVTSETLVRRAGADVDPDTYVAERRRQGTLLSVRYQGGYLHPSRQFLPRSADTLPRFNELLSVLPQTDRTGSLCSGSSRRRAAWADGPRPKPSSMILTKSSRPRGRIFRATPTSDGVNNVSAHRRHESPVATRSPEWERCRGDGLDMNEAPVPSVP